MGTPLRDTFPVRCVGSRPHRLARLAADAAEHEALSFVVLCVGGVPPPLLRRAIDNGQASAPSAFCEIRGLFPLSLDPIWHPRRRLHSDSAHLGLRGDVSQWGACSVRLVVSSAVAIELANGGSCCMAKCVGCKAPNHILRGPGHTFRPQELYGDVPYD